VQRHNEPFANAEWELKGRCTVANPHDKHISCIDARNTASILGTPGGDIGEFVVGLWLALQESGF